MHTLTHQYLGPATVVWAEDGQIRLATPAGEMGAEQALAYPYRPARGDVVLAIGEEGNAWVIGVIRGRGMSELRVPGDMQLAAGGRVTITAERGIDLRSPRVEIRADRLEVVVQAIMERSLRCYRWVKQALQVTAGRVRTLVDGQATLQADRIVEHARKDVRIDGRRIHLG
jgi:hypothetical protein